MTLPPLIPELVAAAEQQLGVTLPAELIRLLEIRNGGVVAEAWDACPAAPNSWAGDHVPFEHLHGIAAAPDAVEMSLLDTGYLIREWELPSPIVLLSGDGHTWLALDYRVCGPHGSPPVVWFDTDSGAELTVAADFRTFVEALTAAESFPD
ncbi:hypothetical protein MB27_33925 [Actinoplanes utahensis]|uniref:Knr4/Smi1-like domain-containing protein n=2 Tax=Actinoplanes utahensis TaxID=1869 RepID=A0A0A6X0R9_ACTUT|nr:hypothetical protein MB27_33925 [Actinoplanes utahensis]